MLGCRIGNGNLESSNSLKIETYSNENYSILLMPRRESKSKKTIFLTITKSKHNIWIRKTYFDKDFKSSITESNNIILSYIKKAHIHEIWFFL